MESDESTGGAAQRVGRSAPAAVLRYLASWQCAHAKRHVAMSRAGRRVDATGHNFQKNWLTMASRVYILAQSK